MTHRAKRFTEPHTKQVRYDQRAAESDRRRHAFRIAYSKPCRARICPSCERSVPLWTSCCPLCGSTFAPEASPIRAINRLNSHS